MGSLPRRSGWAALAGLALALGAGGTAVAADPAPAPLVAAEPAAIMPEVGPSGVFAQFAGITGLGDTLTLTRLPIRLPSGSTIYRDVTIVLSTDTAGRIGFAVSPPEQPISPSFRTNNIKAAAYRVGTSSYDLQLVGPAPVGGGTARWAVTGDCYFVGTFYTGPRTGIPDAAFRARLAAANITNSEYSYGVRSNGCSWDANLREGAIIGVQRINNTLIYASFSASGVDQNTPATTIVFTEYTP